MSVSADGNAHRTIFRVFGLTLVSDFAFRNPLSRCPADRLSAEAKPDLSFTCQDQPPDGMDWLALPPVYRSPYHTTDGESIATLHRLEDCDILHFTRVADFYLWPERIVCHLLDPAYAYMVEIHFLGTVLSFFLERRGIPMLHASATVVEKRAVAFLATHQGGKSALAAGLVQAGYLLLTDDILPVEPVTGHFLGHPGYPAMRMWPDEAQHFLGRHEDLEKVHPRLEKRRVPVEIQGFGTLCAEAQPLACIYVPQRRDPAEWGEGIHIEPLRPMSAVMALMHDSFIPHITEALGWQRARLPILADLVRQIAVRRLLYPSGFHYLPRVREAILADLSAIGS